jgi:hypothetical protein
MPFGHNPSDSEESAAIRNRFSCFTGSVAMYAALARVRRQVQMSMLRQPFLPSGLNFEGPALRPLDRFAVSLDENGRLVGTKARFTECKRVTIPTSSIRNAFLKFNALRAALINATRRVERITRGATNLPIQRLED